MTRHSPPGRLRAVLAAVLLAGSVTATVVAPAAAAPAQPSQPALQAVQSQHTAAAVGAAPKVEVSLSRASQAYGSPVTVTALGFAGSSRTVGTFRIWVDGRKLLISRPGTYVHWKMPAGLAVGPHAVEVTFTPAGGTAASRWAKNVWVTRATPVVSASAARSSVHGRLVSLAMRVTAPGVGAVRGDVVISAPGFRKQVSLDSTGSHYTSLTQLGLPPSATITVSYLGSSTVAAGRGSTTTAVVRGVPYPRFSGFALNTTRGEVHGTVSGNGLVPTGAVTVYLDGRHVASAQLSNGRFSARLPGAQPGTHTVKVNYQGDRRYAPRMSTSISTTVAQPFVNGCYAYARACVDLSRDLAWLQQDGKIIYGPVSTTSGRPGYRTTPGLFSVYWKDIDHESSIFDSAPMPYSIFFNGGEAFHEGSLSVWSHGCIHLSYSAARYFWDALDYGDSVHVFGYAPY